MTNAEIAAALDELGVLYELDGAVKYRVLAYGTAATAIRESPVSVAELAAAGRATEIPGVGKTLAEKIDALLATGEIPAAAKLKAKFPPTLIEVTRVPGPRRENRAAALRRARRRHARGPEGGGRGRTDPRRSRASGRRPRRTSSPRSSGSASRARAPAGCCSPRCARSPRSWRRRCASTRPPTGSRSPARPGAGPRPARTSTSSPPPRSRPRSPSTSPPTR